MGPVHVTIIEGQPDVELYQNGPGNFRIKYGLDIKGGLDYRDACFYYGRAVMHALSCAGKVDNRPGMVE